MTTQRIVILGAGFGGLAAAMALGRRHRKGSLRDAEIVLIDKNAYHTYTPTLYEAATASKDAANYMDLKTIVTFPIGEMLKGLPVKFVQDEIVSIETSREGTLHLLSGYTMRFDYLVIALGSTTNYCDIPGLAESALALKTFTDAVKIRDAVWNAAFDTTPERKLQIVVGGGGATGVELAGELRVWLNHLGVKQKVAADVSIIEANPTVLKDFDDRAVEAVTKRLKKIGVNIMTGAMIASVSNEKKKVLLRDGQEIDFDVLVWTGGVRANPILQGVPMKMRSGRAEVGDGMVCLPQTPDLSFGQKIFAIGDMVCVMNDETGKPVPMVARAAIDQGLIVARNIERDIRTLPHITYRPGGFPYVIPVGGKYAVAKLGSFIITGFAGWVLKGLIELRYLSLIMSKTRALRIWLKGLLLFVKNERLG